MKKGLSVELQNADASVESEKRRILNFLAGQALDAQPPKDHERFLQANQKLQGIFALAAWPHALSKRLVDEMQLPSILGADANRTTLNMYLGWKKEVDDCAL